MADFLTTLQAFESGDWRHPDRGGSNIANIHEGTSSGQAQGFNQITTGTWREFGGLAFAPTPMQATKEQQDTIAARIPLSRWDPKTLAYLRNQGFTLNPKATLADNIALNHGTLGVANPPHTPTPEATGPIDPSIIARGGVSPPIPGTTMTSTPDTTNPNAGTPWTNLAGDLGADLKPLMSKKAGGDEGGGGGGDEPRPVQIPPSEARNYRGPGGNPNPQSVQQVYGATLAGMAPMQWGTAPPGQAPYANAGMVEVPGMSLASQMQQMRQMQQMYAMMGLGSGAGVGSIPMAQDMQPMGFSYGQG